MQEHAAWRRLLLALNLTDTTMSLAVREVGHEKTFQKENQQPVTLPLITPQRAWDGFRTAGGSRLLLLLALTSFAKLGRTHRLAGPNLHAILR